MRSVAGGPAEALLLAARQVGKTEVGVDVAAVEAVRAALDRSRRGARIVLVAQDTRSATRTLYARVCDLFDRVPALRRLVVRRTADEIGLVNDVRVMV